MKPKWADVLAELEEKQNKKTEDKDKDKDKHKRKDDEDDEDRKLRKLFGLEKDFDEDKEDENQEDEQENEFEEDEFDEDFEDDEFDEDFDDDFDESEDFEDKRARQSYMENLMHPRYDFLEKDTFDEGECLFLATVLMNFELFLCANSPAWCSG